MVALMAHAKSRLHVARPVFRLRFAHGNTALHLLFRSFEE